MLLVEEFMGKLFVLCVSVCFIAGCISRPQVTVHPVVNDRYTIQAEARSAKGSDRAALKKAIKICRKQRKQIMVLSRETQVKGLGKILGPLSITVENTFRQRSTVKRHSKRFDTYQTTIKFRCEFPQSISDGNS
jgi:hypothetical protein